MEHFFPRIQVKTKKKGLHQKWNTFFMYWPALRCTPESNYRRDAVEVHTQIVEGYAVKVFGGIYPPLVSAPLPTI